MRSPCFCRIERIVSLPETTETLSQPFTCAVDVVERTLRQLPFESGKPSCVVAHTVKGKGVSFMEDNLLWHYRSPQGEEYEMAIAELEAGS